MITELKNGYYIESIYDKDASAYSSVLRDNEGNPVTDFYYSDDMTGRYSDVEDIKEFYYDNLNESFSLDKAIENTKKKTKKGKLPALSTLSPIMPDGAEGIATFNSGVGLSEEFSEGYREYLIDMLDAFGCEYNFASKSTEELYNMYLKERDKYKRNVEARKELDRREELKNRKIGNKEPDIDVIYDEDSDSYSDGNYYKNGIEFESDAAATEYFEEGINNKMEDRFYLNDMHEAWDIDDINEEKVDLKESLLKKQQGKRFRTITEGLKFFERKEFNRTGNDVELELLYEGIKTSLDSDDIKKLSVFIDKAKDANEIKTYIKGLLVEDLNSSGIDLKELADRIINYAKSLYGIQELSVIDIMKNSIIFNVDGYGYKDLTNIEDIVKEFLADELPVEITYSVNLLYDDWDDWDDAEDSDATLIVGIQ